MSTLPLDLRRYHCFKLPAAFPNLVLWLGGGLADPLLLQVIAPQPRLIPSLKNRPFGIPDPNDPQKGRWGGQPVRNGRILAATVEQVEPERFSVKIMVAALGGSPPLDGQVDLHVHPNFPPSPVKVINVVDGFAVLHLRSWGSFTIGAVTDHGATQLELDLSELPGAPEKFRSR